MWELITRPLVPHRLLQLEAKYTGMHITLPPSPCVSQLGGLPVPWIQRLPVPVWVRWLQTLQRLLRLPAPDPVHAPHQGHAVPPERMLHLHHRQQVKHTCLTAWWRCSSLSFLSLQASSFSNSLVLSLTSDSVAPSQRKERSRAIHWTTLSDFLWC